MCRPGCAQEDVTVCVRVPGASGDRVQHISTFGTTTAELLTMRDWLEAHRVSHVAMESTGVYWRPGFYEGGQHGEDDVLAREGVIRVPLVPGAAEVCRRPPS